MQTIVLILVLAITVEALIQYSKTIIEMLEKKQYKTFATQLAAILTSVFICFAAGVDLYLLCGSVVGHAAHRHRRLPRFQLYQRLHRAPAEPRHRGNCFGGRDRRRGRGRQS